jgi:hypothetical protein
VVVYVSVEIRLRSLSINFCGRMLNKIFSAGYLVLLLGCVDMRSLLKALITTFCFVKGNRGRKRWMALVKLTPHCSSCLFF